MYKLEFRREKSHGTMINKRIGIAFKLIKNSFYIKITILGHKI